MNFLICIQGLNSWKIERIRLKDLIKSLKSRLNEKSLSLATLQDSLANILVAKVNFMNLFQTSIICINELKRFDYTKSHTFQQNIEIFCLFLIRFSFIKTIILKLHIITLTK